MDKVVLGFAPTRRAIFSAPAAVVYRGLTAKRLKELNVDFVDIDDVNDEGLLYDDAGMEKIYEKFRDAKVDGLFVPHCNFGTEYEVCRLAKKLNVPVLLWGPRDECPDENGMRLRDSQCGLFATGKVLRRFGIPFTYLKNCNLEDECFAEGIDRFLRVCNVVKAFRNTRVLQISTRPFDFWSTMCNEGELLEKFGIQLSPIPMPELTQAMNDVKENSPEEIKEVTDYCREKMCIKVTPEQLDNVAALKIAMTRLGKKYGCNCGAIQCWNALQDEIGIMPCAANALCNDEGFPIACETDIDGTITSVLVEAAAMGETRSFFADWTVRHPYNDNAELLQHCGPWPISIAKEKPTIDTPVAFDCSGSLMAQAKDGEHISLVRFDGDNGEYSLLLGNAKTVDGPYTKGTYMWVEVENLDRLEDKLVQGPYIHHCVGVHQDVVPVLYEACKYIGVTPDLYDPIEEKVKAIIRGEKVEK